MSSLIVHIAGLTAINSSRPYFRKHVLNTLESHDYLFINGFFITIAMSMYFLYLYLSDPKSVVKTYKNCCRLTYSQLFSLSILSIFALLGTLLIIDADKNHNTPSMNYIIFKSISMICLFLIGYFVFEEIYNWKQIAGIILIIMGITVLIVYPL